MKVVIKKINQSLLSASDILAVGVFSTKNKSDKDKNTLSMPKPLKEWDIKQELNLAEIASKEGFEGQGGQYTSLFVGKKRVVFFGLGVEKSVTLDCYRKFAAAAYTLANGKQAKSLSIWVPQAKKLGLVETLEAASTGAMLSAYRFDKYFTEKKPKCHIKDLTILSDTGTAPQFTKASLHSDAKVAGTTAARDLVNECPTTLNPVEFAKRAQNLVKGTGLQITVMEPAELKKEKMGMMLAVARAAMENAPPRLVKLSYKPKAKSKKHVVLVGKGLTYDTGGLSLKPGASMRDMKTDMSGAACVMGTMLALAALKPKMNVTGYLACVENGIGPRAYHPDDIITSRKGLTVEIDNTDAEGRLVLGDTLTYACDKDNPTLLIDVATLTGASMVALGEEGAAIYSNDDSLPPKIHASGKDEGESFWHMPLNEELYRKLSSPVADMKNCGDRWGGSITAALFLKKFVADDVKWMHLDIAGPASMERSHPYIPKGGVGFGVRTLVEFFNKIA